jgi:cyanophycin synthetase
MIKNKLLEKGVTAEQIEVVPDEQEATTRALEMGAHGDLVLILGDNVKRTWKQIIYFNSGAKVVDRMHKPASSIELPEVDDFELGDEIEIISDERGVRIAREESD